MSLTTLSTERLTLRRLTKPSQRQLDWLRDPEIVKFSEQRHRNHTLSTQLRYLSSFEGKSIVWGIYEAKDGEHIGNVSALVDINNDVADVGIMIGEKKFWGKGIGKEAWKAACAYLLHNNDGGVRKLEAGCMKSNEAMLRIIRGAGFKQEGELLNHFMHNGGTVSAVLFGRMR